MCKPMSAIGQITVSSTAYDRVCVRVSVMYVCILFESIS